MTLSTDSAHSCPPAGLAGVGALVAFWQVWRNRQAENARHHADRDDREHHRNEVAQWAKDATANRGLDSRRWE